MLCHYIKGDKYHKGIFFLQSYSSNGWFVKIVQKTRFPEPVYFALSCSLIMSS